MLGIKKQQVLATAMNPHLQQIYAEGLLQNLWEKKQQQSIE